MDTTPTAPAIETKERHLTVSSKWFTRTRRNIQAPEIRLAGVYLQKLGFTIGSKVTVIEKPGEIIVRLDGASAEWDPEETADDRHQARKLKKVTAYQANTQRPLSDDIITQYLSGQMSLRIQDLVTRLIDGEVPEPYQNRLFEILENKYNPLVKDGLCDTLLWEIRQLPPKVRRKRPAQQAKPSEKITKPAPTKTIPKILQSATVQGNLLFPTSGLEVAEAPQEPKLQAAQPPQEEVLDAGRNHIRKVLRSLRPLPPPPPRDPAAGPTLRERLESIGPRIKPSYFYDYPEVIPYVAPPGKDQPSGNDGPGQPDKGPEIVGNKATTALPKTSSHKGIKHQSGH